MINKQVEILKFFVLNKDKEYSIKELCKVFNLTQPTMWKHIRALWYQNFIIKVDTEFPVKYKFNELILALIDKTS